jgi:NCAIR mutase (PurE)-related protein
MTDEIKKTLEGVARKEISIEEAYDKIKGSMLIDIDGIVKFDHYRESRTGIPEVIYAENKTAETCIGIIEKVLAKKSVLLFTRLNEEHKKHFRSYFKSNKHLVCEMENLGNTAIIFREGFSFSEIKDAKVGIITAGTSDIPVAKEAEAVLKVMGIKYDSYYDIGVAGLHRLLDPLRKILDSKSDVIIAIAGMEGALPSVIAGLVDIPVIAVPVSVGYGVKPAGEVALLSMLSSCSPGIGVVNIDAGFNAGALAGLISLRRTM